MLTGHYGTGMRGAHADCRRNARDYEQLPPHAEARPNWVLIIMMTRA